MKRLFSLLAAVMFCASVMAQAVIKFEKTSLDFGKFRESKVQVGEFVFTNTGNKPLVIFCGCTTFVWRKSSPSQGTF